MPAVVVRRCVVRVVRRGGWGWGPNPRAAADRAVAALGRALEQLAAAAGAPADEVHVTRPVRATVRLTAAEWLALAADSPGLAPAAVAERVTRAVLDAVRPECPTAAPPGTPPPTTARAAGRRAIPAAGGAAAAALEPGSAVLAMLLTLRRRGELGVFLRALPPAVLAAWHATLFADAVVPDTDDPTPPDPAPPTPAALAAAAAAVGRLAAGEAVAPALRLVQRMVAAVELAARFAVAPGDARCRAAVGHAFPELDAPGADARPADVAVVVGPADAAPTPAAPAAPAGEAATARPAGAPAAPRGRVTAPAGYRAPEPAGFEVRVASVLPFLLLGPLRLLGVFDAWAAVADAAGRPDGLPELAAALAYKVLPPPARGWLRSAETTTAAAAFAGADALVPGSAVSALVADPDAATAPLAAAAGLALAAGRAPDAPVVLRRLPAAAGWLLLDADGLVPLALADDPAGVAAAMPARGDAVAAVDGDSGSPAALRELAAAGVRFVTDAPPTRGEPWRRVKAPGRRPVWTNDPAPPAAVVGRVAADLPRWVEQADAFWAEVAVARPAAPAGGRGLDAGLAVVAGGGLGQLAWELWRDREPTDPLLPLERLADLGGVLRSAAAAVTVTLPLGRRSEHLAAAGLLDDVPGVPWLGGRAVRFRRG